MKKNKIILSLMILFASLVFNGQNLVVYTSDGAKTVFEISSIDSMKILSQEDISIMDTDIFSNLEKDEMVYVEGGTFTMGATSEQGTSDPYDDEYPTHQVTLSDFYIGKYEVTQQLWEYVMKYSGTAADGSSMSAYASDVWLDTNPSSSYGVGIYYPAYYVSWEDIVNIFIPRLNRITGKTFRLPTEAEWEYAARGGNKSKGYKYSGSNTIDDVAWYYDNAYNTSNNYGTHQVGTKAPNELGIYDMSGNVWEWCSDWYGSYSSSSQTNPIGPTSGSYRVLRGGSWDGNAQLCRVSNRYYSNPDFRYYIIGFRLVCSGTETPEVPSEEPETPGTEEKADTDIFSNIEKDEMVYVEGGTFTMGAQSSSSSSSNYDSDAYSDESPVHQVTLSDFYIGKYEVTQQLWEYVMKYSGTCADGSSMSAYASDVWLGTNPSSSYGVGDYYPAYYVSWEDIVNIFIPRLNKITGKTFRLPTEAEWEYAARGGSKSKGYKYSGSNTIGDVAWYLDNACNVGSSSSDYGTHQVGTKSPNELGIYDMSGNVYEWCSDWYSSYSSSSQTNPTGPTSGSYRVLRGGGWDRYAQDCRVSFRDYSGPVRRYYGSGFRLALCP